MPLLREGESGQLIEGSASGDVLTWDETDREWNAEPVSGLGITTDDSGPNNWLEPVSRNGTLLRQIERAIGLDLFDRRQSKHLEESAAGPYRFDLLRSTINCDAHVVACPDKRIG